MGLGAGIEILERGTQAAGDEGILCETCLERGRERTATVIKPGIAMCADCFGGKPFRKTERIGDSGDEKRRRREKRYEASPKRKAKNREYNRRWRERNAERLRSEAREWRRLKRALSVD